MIRETSLLAQSLLKEDWLGDFDMSSSSEELNGHLLPFDYETDFCSALDNFVTFAGASNAATKILENEEIRKEITKQIFSKAHQSLKK